MYHRSYIIVILVMVIVSISGCRNEEPVVAWTEAITIQEPPPTTDDYFPLLDIWHINNVENVVVRTFNRYRQPIYTPLIFTGHGLINGQYHLLVPLTEQSDSVFNQLGMLVDIDITGKHAAITRGVNTVTFSESFVSMFKNGENPRYLPDMPMKYRGTLYVPFEPILDAFGITWSVVDSNLVLGG